MKKAITLIESHKNLLRLLMRKGSLSRKALAITMQLTPAALTRISSDLLQLGMIKEVGEVTQSHQVGRRQILLSINDRFGYAMTVNLSYPKVSLAIVSISGKIISQKSIAHQKEQTPADFIAQLCQQLRTMQEMHKIKPNKILGVGITTAQEYQPSTGLLPASAGFWQESVHLERLFASQLPYTLFIVPHMQAFSQAHLLYMGNHGHSMLCVQWDSTISSMFVQHQQHTSSALGNIAHVLVEPAGKLCSCGRQGCLNNYVSSKALLQSLEQEHQQNADAVLADIFSHQNLALQEHALFEVIQRSDLIPTSLRNHLEAAAAKVAYSLLNTTTLLQPDYVLCFGSFFEQESLYRMVIDRLIALDAHYPVQIFQRSWLSYQRQTIAGLSLVVHATYLASTLDV